MQREYIKYHPRGELPVKANDAVFSMHAVILNIIIICQCLLFERGEQKVSLNNYTNTARGILDFSGGPSLSANKLFHSVSY